MRAIVPVLFLGFLQPAFPVPAGQEAGGLKLMWYNVENLFHPSDGPASGDEAFTPEGERGWTHARYRDKVTRLARIIIAGGEWDPPGVVGLAEVENARVLEDLVGHPLLVPYGYGYIHRDGPDHRGMEVACLFRGDRFTPTGWTTYPPPGQKGLDRTRRVLHVWGTFGGGDTLDVLLAHFISRYRGSGSTAGYRRRQSAELRSRIDSIRQQRSGGVLVLAGDFNAAAGGYSLEPLVRDPGGLHPLIPRHTSHASYKYRALWESIDHIMVLGDAYRASVRLFDDSFMLTADDAYGGEKPYRTYEGFRYRGGASDHLPLLLFLLRRRGNGL